MSQVARFPFTTTGSFASTNFTLNGTSSRVSTSGGVDVFVANLDYSGVPLNGFRMGSTGGDTYNDMGVDSFGNVYVSLQCPVLPCTCGAVNTSSVSHVIARALTVSRDCKCLDTNHNHVFVRY